MAKQIQISDISPEISEKSAVFPGDHSFQSHAQLDFKKGDHLTLHSITTTTHIGAHADAPVHYHPNGESIHERPLHYYLGPCQVITLSSPPGARLAVEQLQSIELRAERILFRTLSAPRPNEWNSDFNSLSPELIDYLAKKGVILVAIDTPSIDPHDSKKLESHQALFKNNMAVLEGLNLKEIADGIYTLIALPLKIRGGDASPVRAVLLKGDLSWR